MRSVLLGALFLFGLYFYSPSSVFSAACGGVSTLEIVECAEQNTKHWDMRLNKAYMPLMRSLDALDAKNLKDMQRKWMAFRDAKCEFQLETGTMRQIMIAGCFEEMTERQALYLEAILGSLE